MVEALRGKRIEETYTRHEKQKFSKEVLVVEVVGRGVAEYNPASLKRGDVGSHDSSELVEVSEYGNSELESSEPEGSEVDVGGSGSGEGKEVGWQSSQSTIGRRVLSGVVGCLRVGVPESGSLWVVCENGEVEGAGWGLETFRASALRSVNGISEGKKVPKTGLEIVLCVPDPLRSTEPEPIFSGGTGTKSCKSS